MAKGYVVENRVSKSGKKSFRAKVRYKYIVCSETFQTSGTAHKFSRETCNSIDDGSYRNVAIKSDYRNLKLCDALDEYIDGLADVSEKEQKYKKNIKNKRNSLCRYPITKLTLSHIDVQDVKAFIRQCRKDGKKPNTIRNLYNGVSRIYTYGNSEWDLKLINPISQLDNTSKPKKSKLRDRRLEDGEYEILVEEAHRSVEKRQGGPDSAPWLPFLIRFLTHSGLRLGETSRIESDENAVRNKLVYLHGTKTDNDRKVPLTQGAHDALMDFREHWGEETIFNLSEKTLSGTFYRFKKRLEKEGKLKKNLTLHDLRHEGLSRLFEIKNSKGEAALPLAHVIKISGHKDVQTLMETYVKLDPADTVKLLEAVGA